MEADAAMEAPPPAKAGLKRFCLLRRWRHSEAVERPTASEDGGSHPSAAIRRCGELLKQVPEGHGARDGKRRDGDDPPFNRTTVATEAGISERQRKTALRVASVPENDFHRAVESPDPPRFRLRRMKPDLHSNTQAGPGQNRLVRCRESEFPHQTRQSHISRDVGSSSELAHRV